MWKHVEILYINNEIILDEGIIEWHNNNKSKNIDIRNS